MWRSGCGETRTLSEVGGHFVVTRLVQTEHAMKVPMSRTGQSINRPPAPIVSSRMQVVRINQNRWQTGCSGGADSSVVYTRGKTIVPRTRWSIQHEMRTDNKQRDSERWNNARSQRADE